MAGIDDANGGALIVVRRAGGFWRDSLSKYKVRVDDKTAAALMEYETARIPVQAGPHTVQVRINLLSSSARREVHLDSGESCYLWCRPGGISLSEYVYLEVEDMPDIPLYEPRSP